MIVCEVEKEFRDEAISGGPRGPQALQVALTQIVGIDGVLQRAVVLLLVMEAVAVRCRNRHSGTARNVATD